MKIERELKGLFQIEERKLSKLEEADTIWSIWRTIEG